MGGRYAEPVDRFYITTPIYYVNDVPHLGHAYCTVNADALARWHRMLGDDTLFLTGTDEHGAKVAEAAEKNGVSPKEWTDRTSQRFQDAWAGLEISNDDFIRTTDERHHETVRHFLQKIYDNGYIVKDTYSGLNITHAGCQRIAGFQALAVVRSRHYEWFEHGVWNFDVTSDFGRIWRQNIFLRGMVDRAKGIYNPLTINTFLSKLPQGIALDTNFSLNELIGLAVKFHSINPATIQTVTLPVAPGQYQGQDVEFVQQPLAQQLLVKIFGDQLITPTNPPPNVQGQTPLPPHITVPTTTTTLHRTTTTAKHAGSTVVTHPTTTTTTPPEGDQYFDPTVCAP